MSDKGPWSAEVWKDGKVVLQSDDFEHDVALIVSGDFESQEQKLSYAQALAVQLNSHDRSMTPSV